MSLPSRPARAARILPAVLMPLALLAGCGGGDDGPDAATDVGSAATSASPEPDPAVSETASSGSSGPAEGNDVCALLSTEEVASVIGTAGVATDYVIGSLEAPDGGQCVWSDDPASVTSGGTANLELVVYRGQLALPPDDAPEPGSSEVVTLGNAVYFTTADAVLALRVTGTKASDAAAVSAAAALVPAVQGRL